MTTKILRRRDVEELIGLSRATIYRLIEQGLFPGQIRLGPGSVGWLSEDIENWIRSRPPVNSDEETGA